MNQAPLSEVQNLLAKMEKVEASDLHIKVGAPPIFRIHGVPQRMKGEPISFQHAQKMMTEVMNEEQRKALETDGAADFALAVPGVGRFRVNVYTQRGAYSMAARRVNNVVPTFEQLLMPKAINRIPVYEDGLALVVGPTGSGKSTTLAAVIDRINKTRKVHVLTIENPIEYTYKDDKAFVNQREIGMDTPDFHTALRHALREDPDVILVGEMRDAETVETALAAAETGHLVFGTLHATNAMQTITRILDFFPPDRQDGIRQVISYTLRAVVAQRLVPGMKKEYPRVPSVELMIVTPPIRKYIADNEDHKIPEAIRNAAKDGMQDFNMSLYRLAKDGLVEEDMAVERSPQPEQLRSMFRGMMVGGGGG